MGTDIFQAFGNGEFCIIQLEWMPIIHTKCIKSLGTSFYMANMFHVFCTSGGFSLLENYQQNAPEEVIPKLGADFLVFVMSSGSMKCFCPPNKRVWSSRILGGSHPK